MKAYTPKMVPDDINTTDGKVLDRNRISIGLMVMWFNGS